MAANPRDPAPAIISAEEEIVAGAAGAFGFARQLRIPISIDTRKAAVAEAAIAAGAEIVNDVSALQFDPAMGEVARRRNVPIILMHMRGDPGTCRKARSRKMFFGMWQAGLRAADRTRQPGGIANRKLFLIPGSGLAKVIGKILSCLRIWSGSPRWDFRCWLALRAKHFWVLHLGSANSPAPPGERIWGTAATITAAILGGAHIVRVHDVSEMAKVARVADAIAAEL